MVLNLISASKPRKVSAGARFYNGKPVPSASCMHASTLRSRNGLNCHEQVGLGVSVGLWYALRTKLNFASFHK